MKFEPCPSYCNKSLEVRTHPQTCLWRPRPQLSCFSKALALDNILVIASSCRSGTQVSLDGTLVTLLYATFSHPSYSPALKAAQVDKVVDHTACRHLRKHDTADSILHCKAAGRVRRLVVRSRPPAGGSRLGQCVDIEEDSWAGRRPPWTGCCTSADLAATLQRTTSYWVWAMFVDVQVGSRPRPESSDSDGERERVSGPGNVQSAI